MKWFKHSSTARDDVKIQELIEEFGLVGYAYYFTLVEFCAKNWKEKDPPEFFITQRQLNQLWNTVGRRSGLVLERFQTSSLLEFALLDNKIKIIFPKLLEIRDNHSRNLQVACKKLSPREEREKRRGEEQASPPPEKPDDSKFSLTDLWNENCGGLPKVVRLSAEREKKCKALLKEFSEKKFWEDLISDMSKTPFLNGKNERGWRADFDFLLQPKSFNRLIEGYYKQHNKTNKSYEEADI
jgi:hypothetical protein